MITSCSYFNVSCLFARAEHNQRNVSVCTDELEFNWSKKYNFVLCVDREMSAYNIEYYNIHNLTPISHWGRQRQYYLINLSPYFFYSEH